MVGRGFSGEESGFGLLVLRTGGQGVEGIGRFDDHGPEAIGMICVDAVRNGRACNQPGEHGR